MDRQKKTSTARELRHASHWGAFTARVEDGRLVGIRPFAHDPEPSPILDSIPDAVHDVSRGRRPAIRQGGLDEGPGGRRERRGAGPFVEVARVEALQLAAAESHRGPPEQCNPQLLAGFYAGRHTG